jgi:hypothetical protein
MDLGTPPHPVRQTPTVDRLMLGALGLLIPDGKVLGRKRVLKILRNLYTRIFGCVVSQTRLTLTGHETGLHVNICLDAGFADSFNFENCKETLGSYILQICSFKTRTGG